MKRILIVASAALVALVLAVPIASGQTTLAITEFINDPTGADTNFEWVEIFNYGSYAVNLSGWTIRDEDSDNDAIPAFSLGSGQFAIIAADKTEFQNRWLGGAAAANVLEVPGLTLANTTDEIRLVDSAAAVRWDLAYADDETGGRATFLAIDDFSATSFGSKATPGVDRNGLDSTATLGYESNNNTADALAVTQGGDTGSPLAGNYTAAAFGASPFTYALPDLGSTTTINFNDFTGAGFAPNPAAGQFDSDNISITGLEDGDLSFGGTQTGNDFALGEDDGGVAQGGIYAFDPNNDDNRALGVQPTGNDFTPGAITLRLPNETDSVIDELVLSVDVLINNDQPRGNTLDVSFSTDGNNFSLLQALTSDATADALGFQTTNVNATLSGLGLNPGDFLFLRFAGDDSLGSGSRDEFAIDNLIITQVVPEPASVVAWCLLATIFLAFQLRRR